MYKNRKGTKKIALLFSVFFLTIVGISIYFVIDDAEKTATIKLVVAPVSADILINGQPFDNMETYKVKPGDYKIVVSKPDYFETFTKSFTLESGDSKEFYLELQALPNTDWYKNHPDDAHSIDTIINHELSERSNNLAKNYPLLTKLPIKVEYYKNNSIYIYYIITYQVEKDNQPTIIIKDFTGGNYNSALERLKAEGFNPDDYNTEYQDKTNEIAPTFTPE